MGGALLALAAFGAPAAEPTVASRMPSLLTPLGLQVAGDPAARALGEFVVETELQVRALSPALSSIRNAVEAESGRADGLPSSPVPGEVAAAYRFPAAPVARQKELLRGILGRMRKLGRMSPVTELFAPTEDERKAHVAAEIVQLRSEEAALRQGLSAAPRTARLLSAEFRRLEAWTSENDPRECVLKVRVVEQDAP